MMAKKVSADAGPGGLAGKVAPGFTLPASGGGKVKLADFKGKSAVVLFFYSKDMTSG